MSIVTITDYNQSFGFLKCPDTSYITYRVDDILGAFNGLDIHKKIKWNSMSFVRAPIEVAQKIYNDAIEYYLGIQGTKTPYDDWGWRFFMVFGFYKLNENEGIVVAVDDELSVFYDGFFDCFSMYSKKYEDIQTTIVNWVTPYFCGLDVFFDDETIKTLFAETDIKELKNGKRIWLE